MEPLVDSKDTKSKKTTKEEITYFSKEDLSIYPKPLSLLGVAVGFSLLYWYCRDQQIPFPIEFWPLTVLLLTMAVVGIVIVVFLASILALVPLFIGMLREGKLFDKAKEIYLKSGKGGFLDYLFLHGFLGLLVQLLLAHSIIETNIAIDLPISILLVFFVVVFFLINICLCQSAWKGGTKHGLETLSIVLAGNLAIAFMVMIWSLICLTFVVNLVFQNGFAAGYSFDFWTTLVLLATIALVTYVSYLTVKCSFREDLFGIVYLATFLVSAVFLFAPDSAKFIGKKSLQALRIGQTPVCYIFDQKAINEILPNTIKTNEGSPALTKILDIGSKVYISQPYLKIRPFSIDRSNILSEYPATEVNKKEFVCERGLGKT